MYNKYNSSNNSDELIKIFGGGLTKAYKGWSTTATATIVLIQ